MKRLLKYELNRAFLNRWFCVALMIGCGLAVACASLAYTDFIQGDAGKLEPGEWLGFTVGGCYGLWMGMGAIEGALRYVFFIVAPLLAVMPYAWSYRSDLVDGVANQLAARVDKASYLFARALAVFLSAFVVIAVPYLLNLAILACLVPAYTPDITEVLSLSVQSPGFLSALLYTRPALYVLATTCANAALCGLWALVVLAVSTRVDNRVVLLVLPYVMLLVWSYYGDKLIFTVAETGGLCLNLIASLDCVSLGAYTRTTASYAIQGAAMLLVGALPLWLQRRRDLL